MNDNRDFVVDAWLENYHNPQMDLVCEADTSRVYESFTTPGLPSDTDRSRDPGGQSRRPSSRQVSTLNRKP